MARLLVVDDEEGIRKILLNSETIHLTSASELLLFYASRSQNILEKIKPALDRNVPHRV